MGGYGHGSDEIGYKLKVAGYRLKICGENIILKLFLIKYCNVRIKGSIIAPFCHYICNT